MQHDAFCIAATIHCLLLGSYISVQQTQAADGGKARWRPTTAVPATNSRKQLWDAIFDSLLNCPLPPERPDISPLIDRLAQVWDLPVSSACDMLFSFWS